LIPAEQAVTLPRLFLERCRRSAAREAYRQFEREIGQWRSFTGSEVRKLVGRVFIVGRLKEILVMSTGEKVPPADIEMAITQDALFDQAMAIGEGKPYLAVLLVLNADAWRTLAREAAVDPESPAALTNAGVVDRALHRVSAALHAFPPHAQVRRARLLLEPWTIDNGLLTPTLKLKRRPIEVQYAREIDQLFAGHAIPA
jgi:long-chain acyl-CoA synthetase